MLKFKTYSENIRAACRDLGGISIRQLSLQTGYAYEHMRKIYTGKAAAGKECNDVLCGVLGLPADEMWELCKMEKASTKLGYRPPRLVDPQGEVLTEAWKHLKDDQKEMVVRMVQGLVALESVA